MLSLPPEKKILSVLAKTLEKQKLNFSRIALFHIKTRVSLSFFKELFASNLLQTPSNLICLTNFVNLRPLTKF